MSIYNICGYASSGQLCLSNQIACARTEEAAQSASSIVPCLQPVSGVQGTGAGLLLHSHHAAGLRQGNSCKGMKDSQENLDIRAKFSEAPSHSRVKSQCPGSASASAARWVLGGEVLLLPNGWETSSTLTCPSAFERE